MIASVCWSVDEIAKRLDDRFRLLVGGSRTALPRQQTLRALLDWSHELLSDHERILLRRMSAFTGGWTLPAAEEVCSGGSIEAWQILDLLTHLIDKSLVVAESQGSIERYRSLETIRQYAQERLLEAEEVDELARKHANVHMDITSSISYRGLLERLVDGKYRSRSSRNERRTVGHRPFAC